jgi:hypothetical protein
VKQPTNFLRCVLGDRRRHQNSKARTAAERKVVLCFSFQSTVETGTDASRLFRPHVFNNFFYKKKTIGKSTFLRGRPKN